MRNRRYVLRKGPLVVFGNDSGISKAFRNLPGVEVTSVDRLNLLQLAPGGHLGRFCIWTQSAFDRLDKVGAWGAWAGGMGVRSAERGMAGHGMGSLLVQRCLRGGWAEVNLAVGSGKGRERGGGISG